jgi:hypothetical protein
MEFFKPTYWFTMNAPEVGGLLGTIVFAVFVVCFVLGIVGHLVAERKGSDRFVREVGHRISTLLVVMGLLGVLLFFFSFEGIRMFGARFWYPLWGLGFLVWLFFLARSARGIPQVREREAQRRANQKYIPPRHKK